MQHQRTNKKGKTFLSNIFSTARVSLERIIVIGRSSSIPSEILILNYEHICIAAYSTDIYICLCMIGKNLEACDWPMVLLLNSQPGHNWWELSVSYQLAFLLCGGKKNKKAVHPTGFPQELPKLFTFQSKDLSSKLRVVFHDQYVFL